MRRKALTLATAVITVVPVLGLIGPATALAAPSIPSKSCSSSTRNAIKYTTSVTTKSFGRAKNDVIFSIAPGQTSGSRTVTATTTLSGSVTVSGSLTFSTSAIVASAETTVGLELQAGVAFEDGDSWTVGPYKNSTTKYRDAAAYAGTRKVAGQFTKWKCDISPTTGFLVWVNKGTGTYLFWDQVLAGMVWCDDDAAIKARYGTWSLQYDVASKCS
jgi:hypothetical protein